jgi:hypothetical protein
VYMCVSLGQHRSRHTVRRLQLLAGQINGLNSLEGEQMNDYLLEFKMLSLLHPLKAESGRYAVSPKEGIQLK